MVNTSLKLNTIVSEPFFTTLIPNLEPNIDNQVNLAIEKSPRQHPIIIMSQHGIHKPNLNYDAHLSNMVPPLLKEPRTLKSVL